MKTVLKFFLYFVLFIVVAPLAANTAVNLAHGWPANWKMADWSSAHILAAASTTPDAEVIILASRTGRWKGIFSEHMSLVFKPRSAAQWTRYDVVGWGTPVRKDAYVADAYWYGNAPRVIADIKGDKAASLIPAIEANIAAYPFAARGDYVIWPGPNSNTFVSWIVRHTPGFDAELSAAAVGKDYLGPGFQVMRAPSDTGYSASLGGYLSLTLARTEGFELGFLGSTIGIDPADLAIKLPGFGKLSLHQAFG